jgi:hypothetical protein
MGNAIDPFDFIRGERTWGGRQFLGILGHVESAGRGKEYER